MIVAHQQISGNTHSILYCLGPDTEAALECPLLYVSTIRHMPPTNNRNMSMVTLAIDDVSEALIPTPEMRATSPEPTIDAHAVIREARARPRTEKHLVMKVWANEY